MNLRQSGLLLACAALAVACGNPRRPPAPTPAPRPQGEVLATVNGVAVTREEIRGASRTSAHGAGSPVSDRDALERAIEEEALAQRAVAQGLDRDPTWQQEYLRNEARLRAWRRSTLATLIESRDAARQPTVTDAEARAYYDANTAIIRTQVRVAQLLFRDEASAEDALRQLRAGTAFDDLARQRNPGLPDPNQRPWELGPLRWHQVPEPWRDAVAHLSPGQLANVIQGPNNRFWVVKLLERTEHPEFTFEATKADILAILREERGLAQRGRLRTEARQGASVVYTPNAPR